MYISKSNMTLGLRCPKALHLALHRKDLRAKPDVATQARFDQGNEVGAKAREYFDQQGAVIHAKPWEYVPSINATKKAMASDDVQTIYEGAFSDGTLYSRADILHRKNGEWHLIEVKEGTSVKDEHITDVAIQAVTMKRAGVAVASYSIMFLNKRALYPDLSELFLIQEVSAEVAEFIPQVEKQVDELLAQVKSEEPKARIGRHCKEPYDCGFVEHCWKAVPDYSVFELPRMDADVAAKMMEDGFFEITQVKPEIFAENELIMRAIRATTSGERFVDRSAIAAEIAMWKFPLHFLDFETVMPAIPRYEGTSPYTQVCYQFSCHILPSPQGELQHREYLHLSTSDPREALVAKLVEAVESEGSVVSYNSKFEASRMKEMAIAFPQHAEKLQSIVDRLVDPLPLMRVAVYDREFRGSFSIKKVAPALLGAEFRYDDKDVSDGLVAGVMAERCLRGLMRSEEVQSIRPKLLNYCRQDTLAMVKLWEWLGSASVAG